MSIIDIIKKLYIFECDDGWYEALKATFEPYKEKVTIVKKFVSNENSDKFITLDNFFADKNENVNFIKLDIEGYEQPALNGALDVISKSSDLRIACCCYHKLNDDVLFEHFFKNLGLKTKFTNGYMFFPFDKQIPSIRKGVLRATKEAVVKE